MGDKAPQKEDGTKVLNFPYPERWDSIGFDVMRYYVKRCVTLPGDTFEIRNVLLGIRGYKGKLGNVSEQSRLSHLSDSLIPNGVLLVVLAGCAGNGRLEWALAFASDNLFFFAMY